MDWDEVDWDVLERLRDRFLTPGANEGPYWADAATLASYDFTFGRRIAWKWAAVLEPLASRGWMPPARQLVDWGCGSGVAARSMLAHFGAEAFDEVVLWDYSPAATDFARKLIEDRHPGVSTRVGEPYDETREGEFVLVVSHVLNELDSATVDALLEQAGRAAAVIWLEPGTPADSHRLVDVREKMRESFHCLAPCPHNAICGMLAPGNERHWCHHFARPPTEAFTDGGWAYFAEFLGIDLRSLPYSHLVLDRRPVERIADSVRIIGAPREYSGLMKILRCREEGVSEVELQKRDSKPLWKQLQKRRNHGLLTWKENTSGRIEPGSFIA